MVPGTIYFITFVHYKTVGLQFTKVFSNIALHNLHSAGPCCVEDYAAEGIGRDFYSDGNNDYRSGLL